MVPIRRLLSLSCCIYLLVAGGCATRYQDLLRDRDAEIRDLESKLAGARPESEDLRRQKEEAERRSSESARPADASATGSDAQLARVQDALPDLDVRRKFGRISIGIENTITFDSGRTDIKSGASSVLRRVADVLRGDFADRRIYIEGHTDSDPIKKTRGTFRSNRHLSMERADAVARWLVEQGNLPESRIAVVGYGEHDPRAVGASDSSKAKNRRVEIVVGEPIGAQ
ncbi:MAG: OmpA family protein [Planctomycetes bacterium]|nr:OmpA family protein [Planctomycetota bacterium]